MKRTSRMEIRPRRVAFQMRVLQAWFCGCLLGILGISTLDARPVKSERPESNDETAMVVSQVQPKMIKIFGTGGLRRLEAYQTGFLISPDGFLVTAWSYVLDSDPLSVILHDGSRHEAQLIGFHPQLQIALLKIEGDGFPFFDLNAVPSVRQGTSILAFSNLYGVASGDEPVSVQRGVIAADWQITPATPFLDVNYQGSIWLLDAITSNPGSAGGAITDRQGQLIGMIGKESQRRDNGLWVNYAWKAEELASAIEAILSGQAHRQAQSARQPNEPMTLELLGIQLVPSIVSRTPPFVDRIDPDSSAHQAGIRPDDLLIDINGQLLPSVESAQQILQQIDRDSTLTLTVQRGREFLSLVLSPP